jgi:hypothetical protein
VSRSLPCLVRGLDAESRGQNSDRKPTIPNSLLRFSTVLSLLRCERIPTRDRSMSPVPTGECTVLEGVPERSMSVSKAMLPNLGELDEVVEFPGLPSDDFDAS